MFPPFAVAPLNEADQPVGFTLAAKAHEFQAWELVVPYDLLKLSAAAMERGDYPQQYRIFTLERLSKAFPVAGEQLLSSYTPSQGPAQRAIENHGEGIV